MLNDALNTVIFAQRHRFALWVPVWLAFGIGIYFTRPNDPALMELGWATAMIVLPVVMIRVLTGWVRIFAWIPVLVSLGFFAAYARGHWVAGPKLGWHYYGAVEGTIAHLDRSGSDKPRLTLIDPVLAKIAPDATPTKVRVSLHSDIQGTALTPGARVMLTASLSPPAGPVEPGGFDFQRKAWFDRLGAVGYSRTPVMLAHEGGKGGFAMRLFAMRMAVSTFIRAQIPGRSGAFAAAIVTGDRSEIDPALMTNLRQSNLAHLLAISGLHMGLLTGFVFAIMRFSIAAVPHLSVRWQAKKIGAVVALFAGVFYLLISGANIATQRAFVMVAVMLISVLLDRPAITLRSVAIAAVLILLARPESLTSPGFQMSFAATTALVATFETLNKSTRWRQITMGKSRFLMPFIALVISSGVAGISTAPYSAFHFNQTAQYGLIANLVSVPVMGALVMPCAVLAGLLTPLGLQFIPFAVMAAGIDWILFVASKVAGMDGAIIRFSSAPPILLASFSFGAVFLVLWVGYGRLLGVLIAGVSLAFWAQSERPDILVTQNGRLVGIITETGRALNHERGNGFAAKNWLENDADGASQKLASKRVDFSKNTWETALTGGSVSYHWGKKLIDADLNASCAKNDIVIAPQWDGALIGPCQTVTKTALRKGGAIAIWSTKEGLKMENARQKSGTRLWNK